MKKLMMTLAAALSATALMAEVKSVNVVGYYGVPTAQLKFSFIAVNLEPLNPALEVSIQDLIPGTTAGLTAGGTAASGDNIRSWDTGTQVYKTYFLFKGIGGASTKNNKWVVDNLGAGYPVATATFKSGDACFFYPRGAALTSLTIAGQVPNDASATNKLVQGFNMIGSGFPTDWNPNDAGTAYWTTANGFTLGGTAASGDNIRTWNLASQTYATYFLFKGIGGASTKNNKWVVDNLGAGYPVMNTAISADSAVFFYKRSAGQTDFNPPLPYTL